MPAIRTRLVKEEVLTKPYNMNITQEELKPSTKNMDLAICMSLLTYHKRVVLLTFLFITLGIVIIGYMDYPTSPKSRASYRTKEGKALSEFRVRNI